MAKTHAGTMVNIKGGARVGHVAYRVVQARDGESMPIAELANDAHRRTFLQPRGLPALLGRATRYGEPFPTDTSVIAHDPARAGGFERVHNWHNN